MAGLGEGRGGRETVSLETQGRAETLHLAMGLLYPVLGMARFSLEFWDGALWNH